jgi:hypothetical protein
MSQGKDRDIKDSPAAQVNKPVDCVTLTKGPAKPNHYSEIPNGQYNHHYRDVIRNLNPLPVGFPNKN